MIQIKKLYASVWCCSDKVLLLPSFSDFSREREGLAAREKATL